MMKNYTYETINNHIYRIRDALGVAIYLVVGKEKACLLDTGYGLAGLRKLAEEITPLPVTVLISHGHIDHAFGIYEFDEIYMNPSDAETWQIHSDPDFRKNFLKNACPGYERYTFQQTKSVTFLPLADGQEFDLGEIHIRAFHVPGHTKGMMMFLLVEDRMMLFGDACGPNTMLMEDCSGTIADYYRSLCRVREHETAYDRVLRNHGTCESPKELLSRVMELCRKILDGKDARLPLPDQIQKMFPPSGKSIPCYSARPYKMTETGMIYTDGGWEGNINYRADKVNGMYGRKVNCHKKGGTQT